VLFLGFGAPGCSDSEHEGAGQPDATTTDANDGDAEFDARGDDTGPAADANAAEDGARDALDNVTCSLLPESGICPFAIPPGTLCETVCQMLSPYYSEPQLRPCSVYCIARTGECFNPDDGGPYCSGPEVSGHGLVEVPPCGLVPECQVQA
jgi:hypothetical protein